MHKNVETTIGRLATDPSLRRRFAADPAAVLEALVEEGLELTEVELEALAATHPEALESFAGSLDRRILKAPLASETLLGGGAQPSNPRQEKESDP